MDEVKWAWVLFVAASLAVLIRMALWFLPSPASRHAENVSAALDVVDRADGPVAAVVEEVPPEEDESAWLEEEDERDDWAPVPPLDWLEPEPEAAAPAAPPPEEFHFRRVRWGMSAEEVRAAETGEPLRASQRGLLYATTTLDLPCLLGYSFVQDRLVRARLSFSDPTGREIPPLSVAQAQRRFLFLREQLRSRYGEPVQQTTHAPRDVSGLHRSVQRHDELAKQYDVEIAEAEARLRKQRELLATRYARWSNRDEMVARGLAPYERDLRDLRTWKTEALETAAQTRRSIQQHRAADAAAPLVATMAARWPFARDMQDIELRLDLRHPSPRLEIRYQAAQLPADVWIMDEL
jgi:hypothetical protein